MTGEAIPGSFGETVMPPVSGAPPGFVRLAEPLHSWIDRKLGYFGGDRYVLFYYEPRGQEVIWKDSSSYGFGSGGWQIFIDHVAPLAGKYQVDLGDGESAGEHVLLIDRLTRSAWFARRKQAERFLSLQNDLQN